MARDPALSMLIGELGAAVSASFSLVSCGHCVGSVGSFGPPARADLECAPRREVNVAALQACAVYDRQAIVQMLVHINQHFFACCASLCVSCRHASTSVIERMLDVT